MKNKQRVAKSTVQNDLIDTTIQSQLIWTSIFPLTIFGLLAILVIFVTFQNFAFDFVSERNSKIAKAIALSFSDENQASRPEVDLSSYQSILKSNDSNIEAYLFDISGNLIQQTNLKTTPILTEIELRQLRTDTSRSRLFQPANSPDQVIVTLTQIPNTDLYLALIQPWSEVLISLSRYQFLLIALIVIGNILSVFMLSRATTRIIQPIHILADNAKRAVPGSIFRPIREQGAKEFRELINAFNIMVIQLSTQQSTLRQYAQKALMSQEDERQRISHELHDGTVQDLLGLMQRVELCRNEMNTDQKLASERLDEIHDLLEQSLRDVRNISIALRPPILEDLGLKEALNGLCMEMNRINMDLVCELSILGKARRLPDDLELAVFRIVQEALTNVRKHAPNATRVEVKLIFRTKAIQVQITNNGVGLRNYDIQNFVSNGHLGLAGMFERTRLFEGKMDITSPAQDKTVIKVQLPIIFAERTLNSQEQATDQFLP